MNNLITCFGELLISPTIVENLLHWRGLRDQVKVPRVNYNPLNTRGDFFMSKWNIAAKSQEERDKVNVDLAASGVAYKERLNMPVVAEVVAREQPEHLREYFMERVRYYREQSIQLPRASDPRYIEMAEQNAKK